ncbi:TIR domain-containing protein [Pseudidiomarina homiensis]|uniref:TIR domain-containing protein n=1 Tax=Pseudidiomarina homiensis TaxID=364198 RepID=UPI00215AF779|nr:TIR domain-containing protein [Pseudidiomarina homiensis]
MEREFDIALSFAGEDRGYVDQVANLLRDSGVKVFYDLFEEANLWGKNLYDYLSDVYTNKAVYTIMFISKHYAEKLWCSHERQSMQARAFQEHQEYILPARFDETAIPGVLPTVGYISLEGRPPSAFVEIIHRKLVNSGYSVPSSLVRKALFSATTVPRVDPKEPTVTVKNSESNLVEGAQVVAIADNGTTKSSTTDAEGNVILTIPTRRQYQLMVAHPNYPGAIIAKWDPGEDLVVTLNASDSTGSVICHSTGYIPGLQGRLNPILDTSNRTYLYADNIAINGGENQPATFGIDEPFELEDSNGVVMQVRVLHIQGRTSLIQYVHPKYDR